MRTVSANDRGTVRLARAFAAFLCALALLPVGSSAHAGVASSSRLSAGPDRECATPSIDQYQQWLATGEGTTVPATGSLLVPEGDRYAAKVELLNDEWHVIVVWLGNQFEAQADLSGSSGFWLTYSATDDLYIQLRPASHWSGGDKWLTPVPSTGGKLERRFFSFAPDNWTWLPELGEPSYSFASALSEARGLVFVGKTPNTLDFRGLEVDGYQPPCL
ncbi:hypothetical protein SAMN02982929_04313 [Saccharopolyspora kobensis]|uniref:Uncharacterized protein n=1 Tax=Saccharopolyspora kobensis TaxID=146035 RepID=A0A1H6DG39_9PSEU|nr:hypothetical protein [Saccharopolyspora kobensis]SEG83733.1 hypothetical protein SAMN02982929_04313 [Saccharopolyspora kobensis]SFE33218.1 hypothetical protein SAMN05216506_110230 [Saccharopolyspora kobensis]